MAINTISLKAAKQNIMYCYAVFRYNSYVALKSALITSYLLEADTFHLATLLCIFVKSKTTKTEKFPSKNDVDGKLSTLFSTTKAFFLTMSRRLRYFDNPYPDYDPRNPIQVSPEIWRRQAFNLAETIQQNRQKVLDSVDGGLYVGSGIILATGAGTQ
jgi:hypothetical protein